MMRLTFSFPVGRPSTAALRPLRAVRSRRGIAMVLVLIALGTGTILSAAALTSRDNSTAIGQNAGIVARASWVADAGANFAVAVLETSNDWRTVRNGVILSNYPLVGGSVDAVVTNLQGNPPADTDRELIVTATATVNGVAESTARRVSLMLPPSVFQPVDPFLGEFALFAERQLDIEKGAQVRRFSLSPDGLTLAPIRIGTGFTGAGNLRIDRAARLRGVEMILDSDASPTLESAANALPVIERTMRVPVNIPALPMVIPAAFGSLNVITTKGLAVQAGMGYSRWGPRGNQATLGTGTGNPVNGVQKKGLSTPFGVGFGGGWMTNLAPSLLADAKPGGKNKKAKKNKKPKNKKGNKGGGGGGNNNGQWDYSSSTTLPSAGIYKTIQVTTAGVLTVDAANGRFYEFDDLIIDSDGVLVIKGKIVLHVGRDVLVTRGGTIELADAQSSLVMFVGRDVLVSDAGVGVSRIIGRDRSRNFRNLTRYSDPSHMRIIALPNGAGGSKKPKWELTNNAMVLGTIHAPHAKLDINKASALIGQAVAGKLKLRRDSALVYDPRLDSRSGFAETDGPMYDRRQNIAAVANEIALADPRQGALLLFNRINQHVNQHWAASKDWSIILTDPTVVDINAYYGGYKIYRLAQRAGATPTNPIPAPLPAGTSQTTFVPDAIAPPASASPTHRTRGRVLAAPVDRAVRILEGR